MQTNTPPRAEFLPIDKLRPFKNHPFRVKDDAEMEQLVFSVLTQGLLTPIVVRKTDTEEYEVISGHRRLRACQKAGIETVPALIYSMDRGAAIIALVDSNLHREHLLPSEKAFAYKMKMEAMSHQGQRSDLTSSQVATKLDSASSIGKSQGESRDQVFRYIHPHAFRHTAASIMIANGVDLVNAAAELGHATASTTLNIYAHQVARARAEASGIRAGAFAVLRLA